MLLNEDFQKECGAELDSYIDLTQAVKTGENFKSEWFTYDKNKKSGGTVFNKCKECFSKYNKCRIPVELDDLYVFLKREDIPLHIYGNIDSDELSKIAEAYQKPVFINSKPLGLDAKTVYESYSVEKHKGYIKERKKENVPGTLYPAIDIYYPKEKLLKHFEEFVVRMQKAYFKQYPEDKKWGHVSRKTDGRVISYPFNEWERYFKFYVFYELGKKQKEIAKINFPDDAIGSGEAKVSQHLRKAKNLIRNAWTGDFPGKYS